MQHGHAVWRHEHASRTWVSNMVQHRIRHATWTWSIDADITHSYGNASWT
jgi:hypothetical protein